MSVGATGPTVTGARQLIADGAGERKVMGLLKDWLKRVFPEFVEEVSREGKSVDAFPDAEMRQFLFKYLEKPELPYEMSDEEAKQSFVLKVVDMVERRPASNAPEPQAQLESRRKVLQLELAQARAEAEDAGMRQSAGLITQDEYAEARDKVDLLEAEIAGDKVTMATIRLKAALRRLSAATRRANAGAGTALDLKKAENEVTVAIQQLKQVKAAADPAKNGSEVQPAPGSTSAEETLREQRNALELAKAAVTEARARYDSGAITIMELEEAKDKVAILEALMTGDEVKVAKVRLEAAQRRLTMTISRVSAGMMTNLDLKKAETDVAIATEQFKAAETKAALRPGPLTFGNVFERTLGAQRDGQGPDALCLADGKLSRLPASFLGNPELTVRTLTVGGSKVFPTYGLASTFAGLNWGLMGVDLRIVAVPGANWDRFTAADLARARTELPAGPKKSPTQWATGYQLPEEPVFPITCYFETSDGSCGLLQFLEIFDRAKLQKTDPLDKPDALKIRYKLIQEGAEPRDPATPKDGETPGTGKVEATADPEVKAQENKVSDLRRQLELIRKVKPEELPQALRMMNMEDPAVTKTVDFIQKCRLEQEALLAGGTPENDPRVRALGAQLNVLRAQLMTALDGMQAGLSNRYAMEAKKLEDLKQRANESRGASLPVTSEKVPPLVSP
jgi:hypothetical protein